LENEVSDAYSATLLDDADVAADCEMTLLDFSAGVNYTYTIKYTVKWLNIFHQFFRFLIMTLSYTLILHISQCNQGRHTVGHTYNI